jgi:hypothetical protein
MAEYSREQVAASRRMAEHAAELPVCRPVPGEKALMGKYLDAHGDPSEWSQATAKAYVDEHNELMGGAR